MFYPKKHIDITEKPDEKSLAAQAPHHHHTPSSSAGDSKGDVVKPFVVISVHKIARTNEGFDHFKYVGFLMQECVMKVQNRVY